MQDREPYTPAPGDAGPTAAGGGSSLPAPRRGAARWVRAALLRLALLGFGLLLALLLGEVLVRVLSAEGPSSTFRDVEVGRRFTRSWSGSCWVEEAGRAVDLSFNSEGMRDREWSESPLPRGGAGLAPRRIAVLGDSMVAALAVGHAERFTSVLEGQLSAGGGSPTEVMAWGVAGSSPALELRLYAARVRRYQPEVVALVYFVGNDFSDDWQPLGGRRQSVVTLDEQGGLRDLPLEAASSAVSEWLARNSRLYVWQKRMLARLKGGAEEGALRPGLRIFDTGPDPELTRGWTVCAGLLGRFAQLVKGDGKQPLLVLMPCAEQVYDPLWARTRVAAAAQGWTLEREHPRERLRALAEGVGLRLVDLTDDFRQDVSPPGPVGEAEWLFLGGTGHLSPRGHLLVARRLAEALR